MFWSRPDAYRDDVAYTPEQAKKLKENLEKAITVNKSSQKATTSGPYIRKEFFTSTPESKAVIVDYKFEEDTHRVNVDITKIGKIFTQIQDWKDHHKAEQSGPKL